MATTDPVRIEAQDVTSSSTGNDDRTAHALALLALGFGLAWLAYRVAATRDGSPMWLWVPVFLVEVAVWVRLMLFVVASWHAPIRRRRELGPARSVDVFVAAYGEPVGLVRATLIGCNEIAYPHRTYLLDDQDRPELVRMAAELGAIHLTRADRSGARSGAIAEALRRTSGELVVVLDGDQVPMPDFLHATVGHFEDPAVAFVQSPHDYLNRDSVLHRTDDEHERQLHNEVIGPSRSVSGAAVWEGSASVVRRAALEAIGGIDRDSTTYDFATSVDLAAAGWRGVFHAETLVQGVAPHNLEAFLAQRGRWARGRLAMLRRRVRPVFGHGLSARQRAVNAQVLVEELSGLVRLVAFVLATIVLITGQAPFRSSVAALLIGWIGWFLIGAEAVARLGRGRLHRHDVIRRDLMLMGVRVEALTAALRRDQRRFRPVDRTGRDLGGLDVIDHLSLLTTMTVVLQIALILRLADTLVGWPLLPMDGGPLIVSLAVAAWFIWHSLVVLGVFVRRRQFRGTFRIPVDLPANADGRLVRLRDLNMAGTAFVALEPRSPGEPVSMVFRVPDLRGQVRDLRVDGIVRSCLPNQSRDRFRIGCEFTGISSADRDAVIRYCSVVRPFQELRHKPTPAT